LTLARESGVLAIVRFLGGSSLYLRQRKLAQLALIGAQDRENRTPTVEHRTSNARIQLRALVRVALNAKNGESRRSALLRSRDRKF